MRPKTTPKCAGALEREDTYDRSFNPIEYAVSRDDPRGFEDARRDGVALSLEDAADYARRGRGSRRRPGRGWQSLTTTEVEVVRLAVGGLTNPEIGARLFMSRSTVKTHLSHIYGKLDVANRMELAALAAADLEPDRTRPPRSDLTIDPSGES